MTDTADTVALAILARFGRQVINELGSQTDEPIDDSTGGAGGAGGAGGLPSRPTQATLQVSGSDGDTTITLFVNPHKVSLEKHQYTSASRTNRVPGSDSSASGGITKSAVGVTQFKGAAPGKLTIVGASLGSPHNDQDISSDIDTLFECLVPGGSGSTSSTPTVTFAWGSWFPLSLSYISALQVDVTSWDHVGTPMAADIAKLELTEVSDTTAGQNPTSGAFGSRHTHMVIAGDSLASIAYRAYGKADYWRAIADVNGIDDPLRLRTGTELLIPPREFAKAAK